jgi:ribonuclease E
MKRMLINATQQEELRVALVDGQRLYDLDIEHSGREQKKASIFKGKITRVEPSLEAAFVEYGADRHGFLPLKEISREYFSDGALQRGRRPNIRDAVSEGQEVIVQIEKEERGNKGAALTTFISLAGSYLVLMPNNPKAGGISRRIEGDERNELKDILANLEVPKGMGIIVRTAGVGRRQEDLEWDLATLTNFWQRIKETADQIKAPVLLHQEGDVLTRSVRDYLRPDIGEILIDHEIAFEKVRKHVELYRPDFVNKVKLAQDTIPLFNRFQIEAQIESAFQREVRLPSGGSIVIDPTEALISIDINSARSTKGGDIEETAFNTNKEAAVEVARQLRLRDLGGLIVIDFIDMNSSKHQREVENIIKDALQRDRARVQIGRISRFGLLEMSRQRLKPSLGESSQIVCPRCGGTGNIRGIESLALSILRLIEEEAQKETTSQIQANVPVEVGTFLLNEKRKIIARIEKRLNARVYIVPNTDLETPHYEVVRLKEDDADDVVSYNMKSSPEKPNLNVDQTIQTVKREEPAVQPLVQAQPAKAAPKSKPRKKDGLIKRLFSFLFGSEKKKPQTNNRNQKGKHNKGRNSNRKRNYNNKNPRNRTDNKRQDERNDNRQDNRPEGRQDNRNQKRGRNDNKTPANNDIKKDNRQEQQVELEKKQAKRPARQSRRDRNPNDTDSKVKVSPQNVKPNQTAEQIKERDEAKQQAQHKKAAQVDKPVVKTESTDNSQAQPSKKKSAVKPKNESTHTPSSESVSPTNVETSQAKATPKPETTTKAPAVEVKPEPIKAPQNFANVSQAPMTKPAEAHWKESNVDPKQQEPSRVAVVVSGVATSGPRAGYHAIAESAVSTTPIVEAYEANKAAGNAKQEVEPVLEIEASVKIETEDAVQVKASTVTEPTIEEQTSNETVAEESASNDSASNKEPVESVDVTEPSIIAEPQAVEAPVSEIAQEETVEAEVVDATATEASKAEAPEVETPAKPVAKKAPAKKPAAKKAAPKRKPATKKDAETTDDSKPAKPAVKRAKAKPKAVKAKKDTVQQEIELAPSAKSDESPAEKPENT